MRKIFLYFFTIVAYSLTVCANDGDSSISSLGGVSNFLDIGVQLIQRTNRKDPEDLGSVVNSIRLANQFLDNQNQFSIMEREVKTKPKRTILYNRRLEYDGFIGVNYKFYDNQVEYRKYYDTNDNFTLDTFFNDFSELMIKFGFGPLDYFTDSDEISLYYKKIKSTGVYRIETRTVLPAEVDFVKKSIENYHLYNILKPGNFSYTQGTLKTLSEGVGMILGTNVPFLYILSYYLILDFTMFRTIAHISTFSPNTLFYNDKTKKYETITQILYIKKNLDMNMNFYYEIMILTLLV
ncbi:MAG: hypothetical protein NZ853_01725 [Leptospiraceae bacterium]|nr:hypothetical protein [Leptospiraceae bacterium]MDW7976054.1 hypothetical protein [Leptospiraceae bacterium]